MLIEEMMNKRDFATNIALSLQNQLGKEKAGIYDMEDLETRTDGEFLEYIEEQMNAYGYEVLIFSGWAFTKKLYERYNDVFEFLMNEDFSVFYFLELNTFIVAREDSAINLFKSLNDEVKKVSQVNIKNIVDSLKKMRAIQNT